MNANNPTYFYGSDPESFARSKANEAKIQAERRQKDLEMYGSNRAARRLAAKHARRKKVAVG